MGLRPAENGHIEASRSGSSCWWRHSWCRSGFDPEPTSDGTQVTQPVVIEMPDFVTKFIVDVVTLFDDENPWQEHLVEELEGLQAAIETDIAGQQPIERVPGGRFGIWAGHHAH